MKKFRKIRQYKDCIKGMIMHAQYVGDDDEGRPIYDESAPLGTIDFTGTVKLHGTNAGIRYDIGASEVTAQSRENEISIGKDNAGFAAWVYKHNDFLVKWMSEQCFGQGWDNLTIFGEWCGGTIQKGVALNQLDKQFVVFAAYIDQDTEGNGQYVPVDAFPTGEDFLWKCISDYETFHVAVDLNDPSTAIPEITRLTEAVEACCPFGKAHGVEGIGEGIVWVNGDYCFKTKGEKHSQGGGNKVATVDPIKAASIESFIKQVVTEDRLQQCWQAIAGKVSVPRMEHLGDMMKWIFKDIMDEEGDALVFNDLCAKDVGGAISNSTRPWFMEKINEF